jgi:hypothetical protein
MNESELKRLIDRVSDDFEGERSIKVLENGRYALLKPALPHLGDVTRELDKGKITVPFLEGSVDVVLNNAAREREVQKTRTIDDQAIERSIARYCPYLFWC